MTKDEIKQVLDLSLEYYKSEIFGTNKESEKPSSERIDWIYDKMKGNSEIPNDLEEAAEKKYPVYWKNYPKDGIVRSESSYDTNKQCRDAFIAGAKWHKEQMMEEAVKTVVSLEAGGFPVVEFGVRKFGLKVGDKVRVIIVKEN